ncbi:hypothetical protein KC340_g5575 [Hortaea werneckii]|nr:hypothetical protein KC342_g1746 [Hortaea werneckii]KAI7100116.1 hypothetical protein KC339_g7718 [Hortaea werneckii]KAI7242389.1 hypothetical protein KC365_g3223 [Hortaea werneckii]KAI7327524.1 hypothetical protein KC340_g5575 [Hortaea werneckii]KAI7375353.1 hypothetical protein KC328_g15503 [Hortaea werneckii]
MASEQQLPLPTPAPSPPLKPESRPSISAEINKETRKHHTELNRLIIDRLPLGLPPQAETPHVLGQGIATFARIFFGFESVWQEIEDGKHRLSKYDPKTAHEYDIVSSLAFLRPIGLARTERLRKDLATISQRTGSYVTTKSAGKGIETRIREQVNERPWLLVAYAWVMYMAIFSGGRWIRQQLAQAGPGFWTGTRHDAIGEKSSETKKLEIPGFTFLSFDSEQDGEEMKAEFKSRLAETEVLLTDEERQEVIEAAQGLFDDCIGLVHELDIIVAKKKIAGIILPAVVLALLLALMSLLYWADRHGGLLRA